MEMYSNLHDFFLFSEDIVISVNMLGLPGSSPSISTVVAFDF